MDQLLLCGFSDVTLSSSAQRCFELMGGNNTDTGEHPMIFPQAGTISNLYVWLDAAPGGVGTYTAVIRELDPTPADAAWSVAITNPATSGNGGANTYAVSAGDAITIKVTPSGSPSNSPRIAFACVFTPTSGGDFVMGGRIRLNNPTGTTKKYCSPMGLVYNTTVEAQNRVVMPACTLTEFNIRRVSNPGAGNTVKYTILKNGTATAAYIATDNSGGADDLLTYSGEDISFSEGDLLSIELDAEGTTPTAVYSTQFGLCFTPATVGQFPLPRMAYAPTATGAKFNSLSGQCGNSGHPGTTESNFYTYIQSAVEFKKLLAWCSAAQGVGQSCTVHLRKDGGDETGTIAAITYNNESGFKSSAGNLAMVNGSYYDTEISLSGGATAYVPTTYICGPAGSMAIPPHLLRSRHNHILIR